MRSIVTALLFLTLLAGCDSKRVVEHVYRNHQCFQVTTETTVYNEQCTLDVLLLADAGQ